MSSSLSHVSLQLKGMMRKVRPAVGAGRLSAWVLGAWYSVQHRIQHGFISCPAAVGNPSTPVFISFALPLYFFRKRLLISAYCNPSVPDFLTCHPSPLDQARNILTILVYSADGNTHEFLASAPVDSVSRPGDLLSNTDNVRFSLGLLRSANR